LRLGDANYCVIWPICGFACEFIMTDQTLGKSNIMRHHQSYVTDNISSK